MALFGETQEKTPGIFTNCESASVKLPRKIVRYYCRSLKKWPKVGVALRRLLALSIPDGDRRCVSEIFVEPPGRVYSLLVHPSPELRCRFRSRNASLRNRLAIVLGLHNSTRLVLDTFGFVV